MSKAVEALWWPSNELGCGQETALAGQPFIDAVIGNFRVSEVENHRGV